MPRTFSWGQGTCWAEKPGEEGERSGGVVMHRHARGPLQLGTGGWGVSVSAVGRDDIQSLGIRERKEAGMEPPVPMACSAACTRTTPGRGRGCCHTPDDMEPSGTQRVHLHAAGDAPPLAVTLEPPPDLRQDP